MNLTTEQATNEIISLHDGIMQASRRSVQDAIKIVEIINEQKQILNHGEFLPWIETFPFTRQTSNNYQRLFFYSDKCKNALHLQEAYNQIEVYEKQEKQTEQERKRNMIVEYKRTGIKPDGWDRSLDYEFNKQKELELKKYEQIEKENQNRNYRAEERKNQNQAEDIFHESLLNATDEILNKSKEKTEWKEKIKLSDDGKDSCFIDAIMDYLETLENDNRKIEACQNIIKVCRNISIELQQKAV